MTQKELNVIFSITISIHENNWFTGGKVETRDSKIFKKPKRRDRDQVQEWVSKQLSESLDIYTIPCGMSWGTEVSKEIFDEYWKDHSKITK
jgi:hypothetical protein